MARHSRKELSPGNLVPLSLRQIPINLIRVDQFAGSWADQHCSERRLMLDSAKALRGVCAAQEAERCQSLSLGVEEVQSTVCQSCSCSLS